MTQKLKMLQDVNAKNCITIALNTHRTLPDNQKDGILLKNLIKEAENKLKDTVDKKELDDTMKVLQDLESQIDHRHNLESLLLFVNAEKNISEYVRLTIPVQNQVDIADHFALRDLLRAEALETHYLILVLTQHKARLLEAQDDALIQEYGGDFPYENTEYFAIPGPEAANAQRQTSLMQEFFNRTDKFVNNIRKEQKLPVFIVTEAENYGDYLKIADEKESICEVYLNGNYQDEKAAAIVREVWPIMKKETEKKQAAKFQSLQDAVGRGTFLSDPGEIKRAIEEGRVQTLFLEEQRAEAEGGRTEEDDEQATANIQPYDDLLHQNLKFGGKAVFLPAGQLREFQGIAAVTRY
ncbi:hypothetical protein MVI27_07905 [Chryseobacterium salipaludis]|uniref:baeRF3 domain-containing protein n=1 Tax=Chryseobacterium TaxID=59732 RepID=UPI001FF18D7A|nr:MULTISPECIES: hypothetical protein [Chryseobacterium]MCJ8498181.1 hypothetical protein [Chryseobacterium salipaludis]MCX3297571.1 hypothetical protein [Planobacterium sp. JC490]